MPKNYSSPLDGVSIEDIMSEVGHESASDSTSSSQRRSGRQSSSSVDIESLGTLASCPIGRMLRHLHW